MPLVVSVLQQKGGVGKTTIATSLFAHLVSGGVSAGIIDLDPQGNATAWGIGPHEFLNVGQHCGAEAFTLPHGDVARSVSGGNTGVVSHGNTDMETVSKHVFPCTRLGAGYVVPANAYMAAHQFTSFVPDALPFDVAIVDTSPRLPSTLLRSIAAQSHAVIAPVQPEPYAVQNVHDLLTELGHGGPHLLDNNTVRLVVSMRQRSTTHEAHEQWLRKAFPNYVSDVVISRATAWAEMAMFDTPWKRSSTCAKTAAALWADIENTLSQKVAA